MARSKAEVDLIIRQQSAVANYNEFANTMGRSLQMAHKRTQRVNHEARKTGKSFSSWQPAMQSNIASAGKLALAFVGVQKAVDIIRREWERVRELQKQAADHMTESAPALMTMGLQLGPHARNQGFTPSEASKLVLGTNSTLSASELANIFKQVQSSTSGVEDVRGLYNDTKRLLEYRLDLTNSEEMGHVATSSAILAQTFGGDMVEISKKINETARESQITDQGQLAKALGESAATFKQTGFTLDEMLSEIASITTTAGDKEGNLTVTMLAQQNAALQSEARKLFGGDISGKEALALLQNPNPEGDEKFIRKIEILRATMEGTFMTPEERERAESVLKAGESLEDFAKSDKLGGRAKLKMTGVMRMQQVGDVSQLDPRHPIRLNRQNLTMIENAPASFDRGFAEVMNTEFGQILRSEAANKTFQREARFDANRAARQQTMETLKHVQDLMGTPEAGAKIQDIFIGLKNFDKTAEEARLEAVRLVDSAQRMNRVNAIRGLISKGVLELNPGQKAALQKHIQERKDTLPESVTQHLPPEFHRRDEVFTDARKRLENTTKNIKVNVGLHVTKAVGVDADPKILPN